MGRDSLAGLAGHLSSTFIHRAGLLIVQQGFFSRTGKAGLQADVVRLHPYMLQLNSNRENASRGATILRCPKTHAPCMLDAPFGSSMAPPSSAFSVLGYICQARH